ncbi:uncharacterized protein LOC111796006 [Cucurbita pepo subsp. pepo]|uniref:Glutaredoxin domain-containing protein n=1 Tax=Cucurbita pepo TaxID=3663 RepID=A0A411D4A2_CUCPE|nr:uncharacterized protein LOC111796006 [Cucurbita pepo subsp. pepo]QAY29592.1 hypothetical protein [Cucurbita pepo]
MGCASSKRIEAAVDVYRPAPASFAVFDINAIEEPWVKVVEEPQSPASPVKEEKAAIVPVPILEKLSSLESETPHSWDEVSKALEDLKPALQRELQPPPKPVTPNQEPPPSKPAAAAVGKQAPRKSSSFHTVAELDSKLTSSTKPAAKSFRNGPTKPEPTIPEPRTGDPDRFRSVKENIFLLRDRQEREREGQKPVRYDPLSEFPEKCPPGGVETVVLYTTSLRGVRRTFEDCNRVKSVLELQQVVVDERDVALHGDFLKELKELLGDEATVPRLFVKGRYIGGADEIVALNEMGKLRRILRRAAVETGAGRQGCEGCGGARFVPCLECGGSCKVIIGERKERCGGCNENGLARCPACH